MFARLFRDFNSCVQTRQRRYIFVIFRDVSVALFGKICVRDIARGILHEDRICKGKKT